MVRESGKIGYLRSRVPPAQHNLYVGERTAERVKILIGSALEELENPPEDMTVQGRQEQERDRCLGA